MRPVLSLLVMMFVVAGCAQDPPVTVDGNATIVVRAVWNASGNDSLPSYMPLAGAKVTLISEYGTMVRSTDASGSLTLEHLPASSYTVSVRRPHPMDAGIQLVGSSMGLVVRSGQVTADTVLAKPISSTGIAINEIYAAGPINNMFFFYDQFIELYNASDSIRYLDGMLVARVSGNSEAGESGPGADEGGDGDIDGVTYIFRFPGVPGGSEHPIRPGQFVVLAVDAVNHRSFFPNSFDLSGADWEFYNQYSPEDVDNPNAPNLINMRSDRTVDFLINLSSDVIVIASGRDTLWADGIDISTVVDAVEYQSSAPPALKKTLDPRLDRGVALSPPKYSGQSMQRVEPGSDSNDALLDFMIIPVATPGRQ